MPSPQETSKDTKKLASAWAASVLAIALTAGLAGCGGGGGGGGAGTNAPAPGPSPAPESPTPPPPPPPPPAAAQLEGRLWHNDYAFDLLEGTQIASLDGKLPVYATTNIDARPWPDGSQFSIDDRNVYDDYTDLKVIDLATSQTLYSLRATGYLYGVRPSPASKTMVMAEIGADSISPADTIVIDLTTSSVLRRFSDNSPMNWLPDGRYMRVLADGSLRIGDVNAGEVDAGHVDPPTDHSVSALWVSPKGDKVAWSVVHHVSPTPENDIWVSDIDGSHLERVTQTKMSNYAAWSPDGSKIAFDVDTGSFCNGFGCMGSCDLWWVPASSRGVIAVPASGDAFLFKAKDRSGSDKTVGCDLMAWTK